MAKGNGGKGKKKHKKKNDKTREQLFSKRYLQRNKYKKGRENEKFKKRAEKTKGEKEKKPMNYFFNVGPLQAGGGYSPIDNMAYGRGVKEFKVTRGPSTRRLIDFKDAEHSWGIFRLIGK